METPKILNEVIDLREQVFAEDEDPQGMDEKFHEFVENHAYEIACDAERLIAKYDALKKKLDRILKAVQD